MSPDDRRAQRRWLALGAVRLAGVGGAMLGLILASRSAERVDKILGVGIVLASLLMIALVVPALAHRWRSGPRP